MKRIVLLFMALALVSGLALGAEEGAVKAAPDRGDQGDGPFEKLIIRGAYVIDGEADPHGYLDRWNRASPDSFAPGTL